MYCVQIFYMKPRHYVCKPRKNNSIVLYRKICIANISVINVSYRGDINPKPKTNIDFTPSN